MMVLEVSSIIATGYGLYSIVKFDRPKSIKDAITTIISCPKCYAFWFSLIVFQDLTTALLISLVAFLLDSFIVTKL